MQLPPCHPPPILALPRARLTFPRPTSTHPPSQVVVELDDEVDLASVGAGSSGAAGASLAAVHFHTLLCSRAAEDTDLRVRSTNYAVQKPASAAKPQSLSPPLFRRLMQANSADAEPDSAQEPGPPPVFNVSGVEGARTFVGSGSSSPIAIAAIVRVPAVVPDTDWPPRRAWIIYEPGARMIGLCRHADRG